MLLHLVTLIYFTESVRALCSYGLCVLFHTSRLWCERSRKGSDSLYVCSRVFLKSNANSMGSYSFVILFVFAMIYNRTL